MPSAGGSRLSKPACTSLIAGEADAEKDAVRVFDAVLKTALKVSNKECQVRSEPVITPLNPHSSLCGQLQVTVHAQRTAPAKMKSSC